MIFCAIAEQSAEENFAVKIIVNYFELNSLYDGPTYHCTVEPGLLEHGQLTLPANTKLFQIPS